MRQVLIAGAGDLGTRVALELSPHCDITLLRRSAPEPQLAAIPNTRWIAADLGNFGACSNQLAQPDVILFSASPNTRTEQGYEAIYQQALQQILQWRQHARLLLCSSTAVYSSLIWHRGDPLDAVPAVQTEHTSPSPDAFNGEQLLAAEELLASSDTRLRIAGLYAQNRQMLIRRAQNGEALLRTPANYSNRIHLVDAARVIARLILQDRNPGIVNLVDHASAPVANVIDAICQARRWPVLPERAANAQESLGKRISSIYHAEDWYALQYPSYVEGYETSQRGLVESAAVE